MCETVLIKKSRCVQSFPAHGQGVKCRCVCRGDSGPDPWSRIHSGHAERGHAVWGSGQALLQRSSGAGILPQPAGEHDQVSARIHHTPDAVEKPQEVNYLKQHQRDMINHACLQQHALLIIIWIIAKHRSLDGFIPNLYEFL